MEKMLDFVGDAKVVFVIPLPRYVLSGCCADTEHVSNRLSGELAAEFAGAEKCLREAADMGEKTGKARLLNILSFFGSCESPPQDLTTVDGTSIWAGDGVHLTSNASRVAARKLMADLARGGEEGEPANKRTRLESYQPLRTPKKKAWQLGSRLRRRPDPSRRRRLSGSLASSRLGVGADPASTTLTRGEVGQCAVMRAEATVVPTVGSEGRSEAASAAAGVAGESCESSPQQWKQSDISDGDFLL
jgi:hypothetical protein